MSTTIVQLKDNKLYVQRFSRSYMWTLTQAVDLVVKNNYVKKEDIPDTVELIEKFNKSPIKKTHDFREQKKRTKMFCKLKGRLI